jgi:hypothetical protein
LKRSSFHLSAVAGLSICAAALGVSPNSQAQQNTTATNLDPQYPAPTNLKVLPNSLNGAEVRAIMHQWEDELGAECSACHARDPKNLGPNGRPQLNYADDSKAEKSRARLMYTMVDEINTNYIGRMEGSGLPVSCGTCHQGNLKPVPIGESDGGRRPSQSSSPLSQKSPKP